jgi:hypothetical protein
MWPLFFIPCGKIKQLEVSYDQIAQAFNRKDLIIYTNQKTSKTICLI